jgi:hypothetical protein
LSELAFSYAPLQVAAGVSFLNARGLHWIMLGDRSDTFDMGAGSHKIFFCFRSNALESVVAWPRIGRLLTVAEGHTWQVAKLTSLGFCTISKYRANTSDRLRQHTNLLQMLSLNDASNGLNVCVRDIHRQWSPERYTRSGRLSCSAFVFDLVFCLCRVLLSSEGDCSTSSRAKCRVTSPKAA